MLDPGKDPSTFGVIADDVSRANACWPDRISNLLISDLWRNEFDSQSLGWNENKACLILFDEPYDPDEPSRWVSKSVAREADRGRPGTFRPMSRDIAFNMLLAVDEPLASGVIDEAGEPKFRLLAEIELRRFGAKAQEILGDIAITNDARSQFCDRHGLEHPKSDDQEPPQEKSQATPETQPQNRPQSEALATSNALHTRPQSETAKLRTRLRKWIEEFAVTEEATGLVKTDFLQRAREKVDPRITDNMFKETWRAADIPAVFRNAGVRLKHTPE